MIKYFRLKEWLMLAAIIALVSLQVHYDLLIPEYMSKITAYLQSEQQKMSELLKYGGKMLIYAFFSFLLSVLSIILTSRIGSNYSYALRKGMFYKVEDMSLEEQHFSIASLITRTTNDISHIQMLIEVGLIMIIHAPILAVGALMKIIRKNWQWTLVTSICIFGLAFVLLLCLLLIKKKFQRIQSITDELNNSARESIIGVQTVRAYNAEQYQEEKFSRHNNELVNVNISVNTTMALMSPFMNIIMNGLTIAIYWIGMILIDKAEGTEKITLFSDMVAYTAYAMQLASAFMMIMMIFMFLPQAIVSGKRITEVLRTRQTMKEGGYDGDEKNEIKELVFNNVYFKYPGGSDYVLKDINFTAHEGETVAIIGSTGCGKTSLVNLIPRFYDIERGTICINGVDVKSYTKKALNRIIGYVPQKTYILSGTIASNVAFDSGLDYNEDAVKEALDIACASEFVDSLKDGINSAVSRNGSNFSGGQKQRLSIARAFYKQPDILIFDESFSALDYRTDLAIRKGLKQRFSKSIKIIVAQRISSVIDADNILVMDKGVIIASGRHEELLRCCDVYREIAETQLSKEASDNV